MTVETPLRTTEDERLAADDAAHVPATGSAAARSAVAGAQSEASLALVCAATLLSVAAAAVMCSGIFSGFTAVVTGLAAAAGGVGAVLLSYRTRSPGLVQYGALAGAVAAGAVAALTGRGDGTAGLPALVREALFNGGIADAPIAFDPGWKFVLVLLISSVAVGSAAVATELRRPKLGVLLPVPVTFGALLVQPTASTVRTVLAFLLAIAGLAVAYGADLAREGASSGEFELRRFLRGGGVAAGVVAVLLTVSQFGFLFPEPVENQVVPPKRPAAPPPQPDRELFTVQSELQLPWRLGTLDVYQDQAWLTPPYDSGRLQDVPDDGGLDVVDPQSIPGAPVSPVQGAAAAGERLISATFRVRELPGRTLPMLANATTVRSDAVDLQLDPRTQSIRLPGRAQAGMEYTVQAPVPPNGKDLAAAKPPPASMREFLQIPPPPREVAALLADAPDNAFARLQFLRDAFYAKLVAAGPGNPTDMPPERVAQILDGREASPFEITAGEAMLARWAGVPSRIGFGYFGGGAVDGQENTFSVRSTNGSAWLEVYFDGYGWVPIVGTPPRAKSSLSDADKNDDPTVRASEELALTVYVPVKLQSITQLFTVVRYWLAMVLPWVALCGSVLWLYPALVKMLRRSRRRRWALQGGPLDRLAVAYAEWRDVATDFNAGHHALTPLEFADELAQDTEHAELAWLVTRGIWGDLSRALLDSDAAAAESMSRSLIRRLRRGQPAGYRLLALASRASLRDPYTDDVPNLWPQMPRRAAVRRLRVRRPRRAPAPAVASLILVLVMALGGCVQTVDLSASAAEPRLPARLVPTQAAGISFQRENEAERTYAKAGSVSLVEEGRVFTIRSDVTTEGSLQIASLKPGLDARQRDVKAGVLKSIGGDRFKVSKLGDQRVHRLRLPEQELLIWFQPEGRYYVLMAVRSSFTRTDAVFSEVIAYQRGERAVRTTPVLDKRRGNGE